MISNIKKIITFIICCLSILMFSSCSGGIDKNKAKNFINDFFDEVVAENYENAETFLHPERPGDLRSYFLNIENNTDLDFQNGIQIERYTGYSSTYYDSTVGGSTLELNIRVRIGDNTADFTIEIVQNKAGYGIYNLNIDT